MRPDIVKVDRSLVAGIHEDPSKLALLEALARFATTTGAAVCAEGVEELAELRALAGVDVTYAQGYALARPGPSWPTIPAAVATEAASADLHGMRAAGIPLAGAAPSLAQMTDELARVTTLEELNRALQGVTLQLGAQETRDLEGRGRLPGDGQPAHLDGGGRALPARRLPDHRARGQRSRRSDR